MPVLIGHIAEYSKAEEESVYTEYAQELFGVDEYGADEEEEFDDEE